jgi:tRNA A-37 threonylcarbamoyl transferase component Bud32
VLSSGHLLDNRYRLDERIATGGMGDVWRGTDVVLGRVIAVKVLRPAMLADPEFSARFYGEARMMAAFRHPGVVEVYDYASATDTHDDSQCAYLVMAYVEGEPLSTRLKAAGSLGVTESMSIVAQAADALHAAHQNGTVHRDVKPGNLIVKPNGTIILVDFGVARSAAVTSVTGLNAIVGTALYMAPEQVAKGAVTPATDIYALGAVAYHCIAGHPPFEGDNALQVALRHLEDEPPPLPDEVPLAVRELITRAMAKLPADRFSSAAAFADAALEASGSVDWPGTETGMTVALAPAAGLRTMAAPPLSPPRARPTAAPRPRQGRGQLPLLVGVLALLVIAGAVVAAMALNLLGGSSGDQNTRTATPTVAETTAAVESTTPSETLAPTQAPTHAGNAAPRKTANAKPSVTASATSAPTSAAAVPSKSVEAPKSPDTQPSEAVKPTDTASPAGKVDDNVNVPAP